MAVSGLNRPALEDLASRPEVALIELQVTGEDLLDVSLQNLKVAGGLCSPGTVPDLPTQYDGSGVIVAVLDSGINNAHDAFVETSLVGSRRSGIRKLYILQCPQILSR